MQKKINQARAAKSRMFPSQVAVIMSIHAGAMSIHAGVMSPVAVADTIVLFRVTKGDLLLK